MATRSPNKLEMGNIPEACFLSAAASHLAATKPLRSWVLIRRLKTGWEFGKAKMFDLRFGRESK